MTSRALSITVALVAAVALVAPGGTAHADKRGRADALFRQGKKHMADKRYADACEAFEKSQKLDPGIGTQLNIAKCYEDWGKLGRAYVAYQSAERMAKDANDDRAPKIRELIEQLQPNVPHLTIRVPDDAPRDLEVTLDNRKIDQFNESFVVDPGPHTIQWWVKGSEKKTKIVPIDRGADSEIALDIPTPIDESDIAGAGDGKPLETRDGETPGRMQRTLGVTLGGVGLVAFGISSYLTLTARGDYNDALDMHCDGMKNACDMTGLEITRDARSTANKATIVFVVGAALVGGGAALYFLAPDGPATPAESRPAGAQSLYLTPALSPDSVGVVLGGRL